MLLPVIAAIINVCNVRIFPFNSATYTLTHFAGTYSAYFVYWRSELGKAADHTRA